MVEQRRGGEGEINHDAGTGGDRETKRRLQAIALMCVAVACFACLDACGKWAGRHVDPMVTTWFRYTTNVLLLSIVLNGWTRPRIMHSNRLGLQVARSLLLFGSTILNFFALQYLQLTQTISIQFAMPLMVALMAGPILGEWIGPRRMAAILVGFCGILVITRPWSGALHPAMLACALVCHAQAERFCPCLQIS